MALMSPKKGPRGAAPNKSFKLTRRRDLVIHCKLNAAAGSLSPALGASRNKSI
jgi:hypothetical protein